jgi:hypothetical protein
MKFGMNIMALEAFPFNYPPSAIPSYGDMNIRRGSDARAA